MCKEINCIFLFLFCVVALFPIRAAIWYCQTRELQTESLKVGRNTALRISRVVVRMWLQLDANCIFPAPSQVIPGLPKIRNGNRLETSQSYRNFLKMEEVGSALWFQTKQKLENPEEVHKGEEKKYKPITFSDDDPVDQRMLDNVRRQFFESILQENPELASGDIQKKSRKAKAKAKAKAKSKAKAKAKANGDASPNPNSNSNSNSNPGSSSSSKPKAKSKAKSKAKAGVNANSNSNVSPSATSNPKQQKPKIKAIVPPEPVRKIGLNFSEMPKLEESMSMLNAKPSVSSQVGSNVSPKPKGGNEKNEKSGVGGKSEKERTIPKPAKIMFKPITPIIPHL